MRPLESDGQKGLVGEKIANIITIWEGNCNALRYRGKFDRSGAEAMGGLPLPETATDYAIPGQTPARFCSRSGLEPGRMADGRGLAGQDRKTFLREAPGVHSALRCAGHQH